MKTLLLALATTFFLPATGVLAQPTPGSDMQATPALDENMKLFWGNDIREVEVIQPRLFRKESRHEFTLFSGFIPNDAFNDYFPIGLRYSYFFAEDFGVEVQGAYLIGVSSELDTFLDESFKGSVKVEVKQTLQWHAGADFVWSPIHGKLGMFTDKLAHFDMFLAFGAGALGTEVTDLGETKGKVDVAGNVGIGMRFFLTEALALRFDYRQYFYAAEGGGLSHPSEISLGISFFTEAPE